MSPTTGYQRNRLNEGVKNVTDSDMKAALKRGHYAVKVDFPPVTVGNPKAVRAFPGVTESRHYCSMPSKQYLAASHPTGGHVIRLEHHRR